MLADPDARSISLAGARGRLVVGDAGQAALVVGGLTRAPEGKAYEIWVIEGTTPQPAGLFDVDGETVVRLTRPVPEGAQVAVTLEAEEGADAPTGEPLFAANT